MTAADRALAETESAVRQLLSDIGAMLERGETQPSAAVVTGLRVVAAGLGFTLAPLDQWQPIETAPRGEEKPYSRGPRLLLCSGVTRVYWLVQCNNSTPKHSSWRGAYGVAHPDLWMPLPTPPAQEDGE